MPSEDTHNAAADLKRTSSVARSDVRDNIDLATQKDSTAPQEPQITQESQAAKESYDDYIKNLPPPFWATKDSKAPQMSAVNDEAIAARISAVCAPVTAEQRKEDERLKAMSWRERWRDRKARREAEKKNKDPDLRPVERGSRAQLNVFGVNVEEKRGKR